MTEFLHQVVERRERSSAQQPIPGGLFNRIVEDMNREYNLSRGTDLRAQESINRYMDMNTPAPGMTLVMPVLDMGDWANATLVSMNMTYMYTGNLREGFRGWVRTN